MSAVNFLLVLVFSLSLSCAKEEKGSTPRRRTSFTKTIAVTEPPTKPEEEKTEESPDEEDSVTLTDATPPKAQPKSCSDLSITQAVAHVKWQLETAEDGTSVQGTCDAGYVGAMSIKCSDGTWINFDGTCTEDVCTNLSQEKPILNAAWIANKAANQTSVKALCNSGFVGEPSITCMDRVWGAVSGGCTPVGELQCTNLPAERVVSNGAWPEGKTSADWSETVSAICNDGYSGDSFVVCVQGTWSVLQGQCTASCGDLANKVPPPANGFWDTDSAPSGGSVPGHCDETKGVTGGFYSICTEGTWGQIYGECVPADQPACINPPALSYGAWESFKANWGDSLKGTCNSGFWSRPAPTLTCVDGKWVQSTDTCEEGCDVQTLSDPINGTWNKPTNAFFLDYGSEISAICSEGFGGKTTIKCTSYGWDPIVGSCISGSARCEGLNQAAPGGAAYTWNTHEAGFEVTVSGVCDKDFYHPDPSPQAKCKNDGTWELINITCQKYHELKQDVVYTIKHAANDRYIEAYVDNETGHFYHSFTQTFKAETASNKTVQRWKFFPVAGHPDTYIIKQVVNNRKLSALHNTHFNLVVTSSADDENADKQWIIELAEGDVPGRYRIKNVQNNLYLEAYNNYSHDYQAYLVSNGSGTDTDWEFGGWGHFKQKSSGRFLDAHNLSSMDYSVVTRSEQDNKSQEWGWHAGRIFEPSQTIIWWWYDGSRHMDAHMSGSYRVVHRTKQLSYTTLEYSLFLTGQAKDIDCTRQAHYDTGQCWYFTGPSRDAYEGADPIIGGFYKIRNKKNNLYLSARDHSTYAAITAARKEGDAIQFFFITEVSQSQ